jgi:hypothetical protein
MVIGSFAESGHKAPPTKASLMRAPRPQLRPDWIESQFQNPGLTGFDKLTAGEPGYIKPDDIRAPQHDES